MKRFASLLLIALPLLAGSRPAHAVDTWALLVGVSKYQSTQIASLHYPDADATAIRDALTDPQLGNIPRSHVRLLTDADATGANIKDSLDTFLKPNVKPGDRVVVFLAGHGIAKGVGIKAKSFLLPTDVRGLTTTALENSAVDLHDLATKLSALPASQFVIFVDACREDPTPGRGIKGNPMSDVLRGSMQVVPQSEDAGSVTFFACGVGQRAFEDPNLGHGVFTYWILDAIKSAPVPQKPDGAIDIRVLASYVSNKVKDWADKQSATGDFEIDQTPECIMPQANGHSVVLMNVKRPYGDDTVPVAPPTVLVDAPDGATVTIDGKPAGSGSVAATLPGEGTAQITVSQNGYEPLARSVTLVGGVEQVMTVHLQPAARAVEADPAAGNVADMYQRALDLENQGQYEAAEAGYDAVRQGDPQYAQAYARLANLQALGGDPKSALQTLIDMVAQVPGPHAYALLSRQYAALAPTVAQPGQKDTDFTCGDTYVVPQRFGEAAAFAKRAADEAVKADPKSAESQEAEGFALVTTDNNGSNKRPALAAFGRALFTDNNDAANYYGSGFGIRFYAEQNQDKEQRKADLDRAITALKKALDLRPNYYEAHRELAYCYHLQDDTGNAIHEYDMANANRGQATDKNEVAGENVALASLHQEQAQKSTGDRQRREQQCSAGYLDDARDITPNLRQALGLLSQIGLGGSIANYLPAQVGQLMNWQDTVNNQINSKVTSKIPGNIGGGLHLPF